MWKRMNEAMTRMATAVAYLLKNYIPKALVDDFTSRSGVSGRRDWALKVSAPPHSAPVIKEKEEAISPERKEMGKFDPGAPPPFTIGEIRAAIPKHCWVKNPWRSMSYVVRDLIVVFGLAAAAAYFNNWAAWPLYWAAQGTMFWALFVLGHDCGHGSFSNNRKLNSVVGHLLHTSILVPYHGWRISHRTHHQNHGHVENDESWHPLSEKIYKSLDDVTRKMRFTVPFPLFAYPVYLWSRSPGKKGSHFNPNSDLFLPNEKKDITTSTLCWTAMVGLLVGLSCAFGPAMIFKLYGVPYLIFVAWLDLVTYLHHHGHEQKLPWYRGKSNMVSPFSVHQQQLAVLAQQQSLLMAAASKSAAGGGASIFHGKMDKPGSQLLNGNLPVQNWPNVGFQTPGMMMPMGGQNDLWKHMQAGNLRPVQLVGNSRPLPVAGKLLAYGATESFQMLHLFFTLKELDPSRVPVYIGR